MSLLRDTIDAIRPQDQGSRSLAHARLAQLTMPYWALGRLMDLAEDLAGMTGTLRPPLGRKVVITLAGDHGVTAAGVSLYPQAVTAQMVQTFVNGGAGINVLARLAGAQVVVADLGVAADLSELVAKKRIISKRVGPGTANIAVGPAMNRQQAVRSVEAGIEIVRELASTTDLFGTGDMGIGNTTPSSAIIAAITGCSIEQVTGRGAGIGEEQLQHKIRIIEQCLATNRPNIEDGLDVLAKVGGFEIGGIAGVILGAASLRKPVLIDGFISSAGALIAHALAPECCDYMIAAHRSVEQGHRVALQHLRKQPLLDLDLRLGEGTGAALAMHMVEAAARLLTEVATFEEAAVSKANS